jgi:putative hydrolase of the HAD superfamily
VPRLTSTHRRAAATARRVQNEYAHINCWIFDLDLTLYGPEHAIMTQIRDRIAAYVQDYFQVDAETGHKIRRDYWMRYGTTLNGLMVEHGVDPHGYLDAVHNVDLSLLAPSESLRSAIMDLPGRKLIFTNADAPYAARVLAARGLDDVFEAMFDIHDMRHRPKPFAPSYDAFCSQHRINPNTALFIEDTPHNLAPAKALGMKTIWIDHDQNETKTPDFVDARIANLTEWLSTLKEAV